MFPDRRQLKHELNLYLRYLKLTHVNRKEKRHIPESLRKGRNVSSAEQRVVLKVEMVKGTTDKLIWSSLYSNGSHHIKFFNRVR